MPKFKSDRPVTLYTFDRPGSYILVDGVYETKDEAEVEALRASADVQEVRPSSKPQSKDDK